MTTRKLQRKIAPKKDAGDGARLLRVEMECVADAREGEGDVGAVDEGDGVHDQRDGDDAGPTAWGGVNERGGGVDVFAINGVRGGVHRRRLRVWSGECGSRGTQEMVSRFKSAYFARIEI